MADPQFTDAQLSDGRTLRFQGQLTPDQVRAKVQQFRVKETAGQIEKNPPPMPEAPNAIKQDMANPRSPQYQGGMPGSFEGHPENVGEWPNATFGKEGFGGGVSDIAQGNFARGGHKMISGVGNAALPAVPFIAAANPAAFGRAVLGGVLGQAVAEKGANALSFTPDQTALAGDIGNLAGGSLGVKGPQLGRTLTSPSMLAKGKAIGGVLVDEAVSHVPWLGRAVRRPSIGDYIEAFRAQPEPKFYNKPAGPDFPPAGEYLEPEPPKSVPTVPFAHAEVIRPKALPAAGGSSLPRDLPYRKGPGEVPRDITAAPDERVLSSDGIKSGIRLTPKAMLPEKATMAAPTPEPQGAALGKLPVPAKPVPIRQQVSSIADEVTRGLGAEPQKPPAIEPNKPIAQRPAALANGTSEPPVAPQAQPVESSALKSSHYDPETKTLTVQTKSGSWHRYLEVTPEEAGNFAKAESKGKAWAEIRNNHAPEKWANGKWNPMVPKAVIATPNDEPGTVNRIRTKNDDLTSALEESLRRIRR